VEREQIPHQGYLTRVVAELEARAAELASSQIQSVFIGGGTPSLWDPSAIGGLLAAIFQRFSATPDIEVTVECNPTSFNAERARAMSDAGVNRVSIGVQSLDPERLKFLGRWHSPDEALRALETALRSSIVRVSADLIYGVHGQRPEDARAEVQRVAATGVTHLSAYTLTIEKGTQFGARAQKGSLPLLGDDQVADSFEAVHDSLLELSFDHYEISNFARAGHVAEHNLGYWHGHDYLGLGVGAWGTIQTATGRVRYRNTPSPERYLDPTRGFGTIAEDYAQGLVRELEPIGAETALKERLLLGLRLKDGVDLDAASAELAIDPWTPERERAIERLIRQGRLRREGGRLRIPHSQWLLADGTISSLL
jgi:oxygen-independent coproporphyrinogen-3 oxidase